MNYLIKLPLNSYIHIRVALKTSIEKQFKARREMQKAYNFDLANRYFNKDIRDAITAYRDLSSYEITL